MSNYFERLTQFSDYKRFKSLNDFALNGLKYKSSAKLARLKDENNKPSVDIIEDISNLFEDFNVRWFITGKGQMIDSLPDEKDVLQVPVDNFNTIISTQQKLIEAQEKIIHLEELLRKEKAAS